MRRERVALAALCVASLLATAVARAEEAQPVDKASQSGFTALASIVDDPDWHEIWNTPVETTPNFHTPSALKVGEKAWLLTFFSGAELKDGIAEINCDLTIHDADGTVHEYPAQLCYQGRVPEPEGAIVMTGMEIGFEVSSKDAGGLTQFEIGITDVNRGVRVPVSVSVEFVPGNGPT